MTVFAFSSCVFSNKKEDKGKTPEKDKPIVLPMELPKDTTNKHGLQIKENEINDKAGIASKAAKELVKPPSLDTIAVH
jgi:hypothetical protein